MSCFLPEEELLVSSKVVPLCGAPCSQHLPPCLLPCIRSYHPFFILLNFYIYVRSFMCYISVHDSVCSTRACVSVSPSYPPVVVGCGLCTNIHVCPIYRSTPYSSNIHVHVCIYLVMAIMTLCKVIHRVVKMSLADSWPVMTIASLLRWRVLSMPSSSFNISLLHWPRTIPQTCSLANED